MCDQLCLLVDVSRCGRGSTDPCVARDSLQFSSSLSSGQSLKPLQRKRPMMQWSPLAQVKNVPGHFDLALAKEMRVGGSGEKKRTIN